MSVLLGINIDFLFLILAEQATPPKNDKSNTVTPWEMICATCEWVKLAEVNYHDNQVKAFFDIVMLESACLQLTLVCIIDWWTSAAVCIEHPG